MSFFERKISAIKVSELEIRPYEILNLLELRIEQKVNDHVRVYLSGELRNGVGEKREQYVIETEAEQKLEISYQGKPLFVGLVTDLQVSFANNLYLLKVEALSATCNLDLKQEKNSFQDEQLGYEDILKQIKAKYRGMEIMDDLTKGRKIERWLLQYQETDWEFLKRLASHFQTVLLPYAHREQAKLAFGIPKNSKETSEEELENIFYRVQKRLLAFRELAANAPEQKLQEQDFLCYEVESYQPLELGDPVTFKGKKLLVYQATALLRDDLLVFNYLLAFEKGFSQRKSYPQQLLGLSIKGKVIEVKEDRVKLHLIEIEEQEPPKDKARLFPYATAYTAMGNTGWYCMPEVGDLVNLYFPTNQEEAALITCSLREGASGKGKITDPNVKYFRTNHGKEIMFTKEEVVITVEDPEAKQESEKEKVVIRLHEQKGIEIFSKEEIHIATERDLTMKAEKKLTMQAEESIELNCNSSKVKLNGDLELSGNSVREQ